MATDSDFDRKIDELTNGQIKNYLYNEKNKYITEAFIEKTLLAYNVNIKINNIALFITATTHDSYVDRADFKNDKSFKSYYLMNNHEQIHEPIELSKKVIPLQDKNRTYQRLEFLGDSIIHHILTDYLFDRYENADEGFMTTLRAKLENNQILAIFTKKIHLNDYVIISKNLELMNARETNIHICEDIFEAFVGALYKDQNNNYDICKKFIVELIEKEIDIHKLCTLHTNYKDELLKFFHTKGWGEPRYKCMKEIQNDICKKFQMCVYDNKNNIIGMGIGKSKKMGEQEASKQALLRYHKLEKKEDIDLFD